MPLRGFMQRLDAIERDKASPKEVRKSACAALLEDVLGQNWATSGDRDLAQVLVHRIERMRKKLNGNSNG